MTFREFEKRIVKITKMELPGESIQLKMAPIERLIELKSMARRNNKAKMAGVLVLFYPDANQDTNLVLILRKTYKGVHSAQIGFPGGKREEEDRTLEDTALRETEEEVGVQRETVRILKTLTDVYIPPSNYFVQPFLGITTTTPNFIPQEEEVEAVVEVALKDFMDDSVLAVKTLSTSYATNIEVPAFILQDHIVWGATAMMLSEVRELLQKLL